jgi:hypothetical protein
MRIYSPSTSTTKTRLVHLGELAREWDVSEPGLNKAELAEADEWSLALARGSGAVTSEFTRATDG